MFKKDQLSVFDWIGYYLLMAIPLVNIIVLILIMFGSESNPTLKSMLWSQVLMSVLVILFVVFVLSLTMTDLFSVIEEIWNNITNNF